MTDDLPPELQPDFGVPVGITAARDAAIRADVKMRKRIAHRPEVVADHQHPLAGTACKVDNSIDQVMKGLTKADSVAALPGTSNAKVHAALPAVVVEDWTPMGRKVKIDWRMVCCGLVKRTEYGPSISNMNGPYHVGGTCEGCGSPIRGTYVPPG